MPVTVKKIGRKYRVVEPNGRVAKTKNGKPIDGGGHATKAMASRQARAVNSK